MEARVYDVIRKACSSNTELLRQAVDELDLLQTEDRFFQILLEIGKKEHEPEVHRIQALVQFKNRICTYWNHRGEVRDQNLASHEIIRRAMWDDLLAVTFPKSVERQWIAAMAQIFVEDYVNFDTRFFSKLTLAVNRLWE
ncbi:hypothetical protein IWQ62_004839, partial [Dispira parvispora]